MDTALYMNIRLLFKRQAFVTLPVVVANLNALSISSCFGQQVKRNLVNMPVAHVFRCYEHLVNKLHTLESCFLFFV